MTGIRHWLSEQPSIINFRWSHTHSWGATWSFIFITVSIYITTAVTLRLLMTLLRRHRPVPLGPIPAIHSLSMALISAVIFIGIILSAAAEIRETRWFWRRNKTTPFQWLLCFPLGTRPSGRVFFWSYMFYLSRLLHLLRTLFIILLCRRLTLFHIVNQSIMILSSFLWLEFSQSFQVVGIVMGTMIYFVVYGYRFLTAVGVRGACYPFVMNCQAVLLGCNLICHFGVVLFHFLKGGCNGIGAWACNSLLNSAILFLFLKFYRNQGS